MSWLTGWNRRKLITVNGSSAGGLSDYQMLLNVGQGSGTDTAGTVYLGGNILSSFADLRFTKSDGSTLLNYWIELTTGISPNQIAKVWIKLAPSPDSIPVSPGTYSFYIYYNNSSASAGSNGDGTFVFMDDFNGSSYTNKWDLRSLQSYSSISESGGTITLSVSGGGGGSNAGGSISNRINIGNGKEFRVKIVSASSNGNWNRYSIDFGTGTRTETYGTCGGATVPNDGYILYMNPPTWNQLTLYRVDNGTKTQLGPIAGLDPNGKYLKMTYLAPNIYVYYSTDNTNWTLLISTSSATFPAKNPGPLFLAEYSCGDRGGSIVYDYLFIRNFASPEPTWSSIIGTEQGSVTLNINSTPSGGEIWLASPTGTSWVDQLTSTNTTLYVSSGTSYDVEVGLGGYQPWTLYNVCSGNCAAGSIWNIQANLIPQPGTLAISSTPTNAEIYLAVSPGTPTDQGTTTISGGRTLSLSPGLYNITLKLAGYTDWTGTATIASNIITNINATFAGSANITSTPSGAEIYLAISPGTPTDQSVITPKIITGLTSTTSGSTTVWNYKLTLSGYVDISGSFTGTAGQTINIPVIFPGSLYITSIPTGAQIYIDGVLQ